MDVILYKYLQLEFAEAFLHRGEILFRSLSYFRKQEHVERGDEAEGIHIDAPTTPVRLDNLTTGTSVSGAFRFLNSIDQEKVYGFCCSAELRSDLFTRFNANACVQILKPGPFFLRCGMAAGWKFRLDEPPMVHKPVEYFDPAKAAIRNVKDPRNLPFFKHISFSPQSEYRAVFALRGAWRLQERVVTPEFTFADEIRDSRSLECLLTLGSLPGIVDIILPTDPRVAGTNDRAA
ncbi:MAG: hypothetical protein HOP28_09190 [Gemmatimonadales bacterium]|nr:hypothetical protein [Gemmatimonadales bacterium]